MEKAPSTEVEAYLARVPSEAFQMCLRRLREIIYEEVPGAEEVISYGMPGYKLKGYLAGYAAFKHHCSLFPGGTAMDFSDRLKGFKISKGTIQFTPDQPIPEELVRDIIRTRVAQNTAKRMNP